MKQESRNSDATIHDADYAAIFEGCKAVAESRLFTAGRRSEALDGDWNYAVDQYDTCLRAGWYKEEYSDAQGRPLPVDFSFDDWPVMHLPCCWNMAEPELKLYEGGMVFTRRFRFKSKTAEAGKERVFLRIGAANYVCRVFLNKEYVGMHRGGSTPFCFEVTDLLAEDNRILITCDNTRRDTQVPMRNTDWFNYGGIYRSIELFRLPAVFIRDFGISLRRGSLEHGRGMLDVSVELSDKTDAAAQLLIPRLGISQEIPVHGGKAEISMEAPEGLQLWTPEDPQLYGVTLRCGEDSVTDDVGFRTIEVSGTDILLNGKPVFLRGVSCHEDSERRGKALTTEDRTGIITIAKELGCNFMRLAHYPHSEEMSRLADRMGILLWEEVPVYWAIAFEDPDTLEDASNQLREMICRDRNRASVIIWSVGNENADTDARYRFMCTLADTARNSDPTRPVSAACLVNFPREVIDDRLADALDIIGVNEYCGWYIPDFSILPRILKNSRLTKPVIISEFGAGAKSGKHGNVQERWTEEYQAEVYRRQTETLGGIPYIKGMTPWILFDFRCPRRTSVLQNYYNLKGLVSADRRHRKMAFSVLQAFYRKLAGSPDPEETLHEKTDGSDACPADGAHENGLASGAH